MIETGTKGQVSSPWKEHKNGYSYANWNRLAEMEPATMTILKQEAGTRVETKDYIYYVNEHPRYGWSIGRKRKNKQVQQVEHVSSQTDLENETSDQSVAAIRNNIE